MKKLCCLLAWLPLFCQAQDTTMTHYHALLDRYNKNQKDYAAMPALVRSAEFHNDQSEARLVAQDYIGNYLLRQPDSVIYSVARLQFMHDHTARVTDRGFSFFYRNAARADSVMHRESFAQEVVGAAISAALIVPALKGPGIPDWTGLRRVIAKKYNAYYAGLVITDAEIGWYAWKKDWKDFSSTVVKRVSIYGPYGMFPDKGWRLNSSAWDIFQYSTDPAELRQALQWSDEALALVSNLNDKTRAEYRDTHANLLYKTGRTQQAIAEEEQAFSLSGGLAADMAECLQKMKKGEPTWPLLLPLKRAIAYEDLAKWRFIGPNYSLNSDGAYIAWDVQSREGTHDTTRIRAVRTEWEAVFPGIRAHAVRFTEDGARAVIRFPGDSLQVVVLGTPARLTIQGVRSYKLSGNWLGYQTGDGLMLRELETGREAKMGEVKDYYFNRGSGKLLYLTLNGLYCTSLKDFRADTICRDKAIGQIVFEPDFSKVAFLLSDQSIRIFDTGSKQTGLLVRPGQFPDGLILSSIDSFSADGTTLFLQLARPDPPKASPDAAEVDVWSYKDGCLQSNQATAPQTYLAGLGLVERKITRLQYENDEIKGDYRPWLLVYHTQGPIDLTERNWNRAARASACLVSVQNGKRLSLPIPSGSLPSMERSPDGNYLLYFDAQKRNFFSYNLTTGKLNNITGRIKNDWTIGGNYPGLPGAYPAAGWSASGRKVLLYDKNDVWEADLTGAALPISVTGGMGRKNHLMFRLQRGVYDSYGLSQRFLFQVFDPVSKRNGFYSKTAGSAAKPEKLTMAPFIYNQEIPYAGWGYEVKKASGATAWLLERSQAAKSPDLVLTTDFKDFRAMTDIHPEKQYNWLTGELFTWTARDGTVNRGILYKPENFDPHKKYPVIFHYYEQLSDQLNLFLRPEPSAGPIDIPTLVSNGYLVYCPDITYRVGEPGLSVVKYLTAAALRLSRLAYVDRRRLGIQGQSFGGYETDYLVSHSRLFAAACATSGISDLVSYAGTGPRSFLEIGQGRLGKTLSASPRLYIDNSPVFAAVNVTTPVLLMNNKADQIVPWTQGLEFFSALRRLGKKAWLLQYNQGNHTLGEPADQKDFTIRQMQFFGYYLKGEPPPVWMTRGVPAAKKTTETGLAYDLSGAKP